VPCSSLELLGQASETSNFRRADGPQKAYRASTSQARTKPAKSRGLENIGLGDRKTSQTAHSVVQSFSPKTAEILGFSAAEDRSENSCVGIDGGEGEIRTPDTAGSTCVRTCLCGRMNRSLSRPRHIKRKGLGPAQRNSVVRGRLAHSFRPWERPTIGSPPWQPCVKAQDFSRDRRDACFAEDEWCSW
jgi:hypothetical protein